MSRGRRSRAATVILTVALGIMGGCAAGVGGAGHRELIVLAAASLREPVEAAARAYETAHVDTIIRLGFGSSAALRTQIEQGAPADVFLSADTGNPQRLADAGLTDGPPRAFAGNLLALVAPIGDRAGIRSPQDLAFSGIEIVAAGEQVPITSYADELVRRLARLPGYPGDFASRYAANIVSREDDVKAVVAKIELGEGDAAIVYRTDALASAAVEQVDVPPEADVVATYAGVVLESSMWGDEAGRFFDWLTGPEGRSILAGAGFTDAP